MNFRTLILIACCTTLGLYGWEKTHQLLIQIPANLSDPVINTTWYSRSSQMRIVVISKSNALNLHLQSATVCYMETWPVL